MSYSTASAKEKCIESEYECIELDFTILVNGKMANFQNSFVITRQIDGHEDSDYTLQDFWEWYLLVRILMALWYYISEDVKQEHQIGMSNSVIKRWINLLREDEIENPLNIYSYAFPDGSFQSWSTNGSWIPVSVIN